MPVVLTSLTMHGAMVNVPHHAPGTPSVECTTITHTYTMSFVLSPLRSQGPRAPQGPGAHPRVGLAVEGSC